MGRTVLFLLFILLLLFLVFLSLGVQTKERRECGLGYGLEMS